ncbi:MULTISPECIES: PilZ domain-containing protein [Rhizobium/Agrobacterium group]|jgi:hypothetical protein|uniref:PilZ domain-containing protein n=1 Tax=Rhizobium/Agrobacterium group TaxID=227290 RepID=UPI00178599FE|nr:MULTISPECIES: PilZ domain-containing protein [Rhizobium/Agrobacterium group]MBD9387841.1 PilZ domain-containing protein [Agrobacterium sp. AGB01]MCS4242291.1 hypothetical protein [Rhizobium sp. BIGb0125]
MFSVKSTSFAHAEPAHPVREVQTVSVNLSGRIMLPDYEEYDCTITDMTSEIAHFTCAAMGHQGDRVIAYLQHIGRLEGKITAIYASGFTISITATERKREKLSAQLAWIAKRQELGLPEDRRHDRLAPRKSRAELTLEDGNVVLCRIIDLSLSGAAIEVDDRPAMGTIVRLGAMKGRIVRHFMEGVAIEFDRVQSRDALLEFL